LSASEGGGASGKATTSLVLGLCSFLCSAITGIPAIILGVLALSDISKSQGRLTGNGQATAGIVTGGIGTVLICPVLIALLLPAVNAARQAARQAQCSNNLKQINLALINYSVQYGSLPPAYIADEDGTPMHSWRVLVLPFLDQSIYDQYDFDEPWDGPNNSQLADQMPACYQCPSHSTGAPNQTSYVVVNGPGLAFDGDKAINLDTDLRDASYDTILVVESSSAGVHWMEPRDLDLQTMSLQINDPSGTSSISSDHRRGAWVGFADGSVRFFENSVDPVVIQGLLTIDGGEEFGQPANPRGSYSPY
jgi:type II secretory pathway pseudopilin PulG